MKKELQRKIVLSLGLALCVALSATAQEANEFQAENQGKRIKLFIF